MHISNKSLLIASVPLALLLACPAAKSAGDPGSPAKKQAAQEDPNAFAPLPDIPAGHDAAIFAGGCFWCMETAFEGQPGVRSVTSGYSGGELKDPTYKQVSSRRTKHAEVVQVVFDTKATSYEKLLEIFWHNVDPTTPGRQFCDVGPEYRSEVFVKNAAQRAAAEKSKAAIQKTKTFKGDLVTPITDARPFYAAERYHQDFYKKNPTRYYSYRRGCGRDARLQQLWGDKAGRPAVGHGSSEHAATKK